MTFAPIISAAKISVEAMIISFLYALPKWRAPFSSA